MTIELSLFRVQTLNMDTQVGTELHESNQYQQIKQAVIDYARYRPDTVTVDLTGDGGKYYAINAVNFPGYSGDFSQIARIEYPANAVSADETPHYLNADDWDDSYYDAAGVRYLFLPSHAPAATETVRITFTGLYTWSAGTTTTGTVTHGAHGFSLNSYIYKNSSDVWVKAGSNQNLLATHKVTTVTDANNFIATILAVDLPERDFFTVCNRAACLMCLEIAARYARTSDSTIAADSVSHQTRSQAFTTAAKSFCAKWEEALGIGSYAQEGNYLPASEWIDWDTKPGWPEGRRFLFHGRG